MNKSARAKETTNFFHEILFGKSYGLLCLIDYHAIQLIITESCQVHTD